MNYEFTHERTIPMTQTANEFQGFFADFYDRLHNYTSDAEGFAALLKSCGKDVLELGSGTGRIAIPLAKAGYNVTGIEYEADMIALMEQKEYPRENLRAIRADARNFSLGQQFDAVLLSCNFVNLFTDAKDLADVLACCRKHLKPEGRVIIDCSVPDTEYMVRSNGEEEVLTFPTESGSEIRDYFLPRYDLLNQVEEDTIRLEEWKDGKLLREARTEEKLTWYYPREIRSLIREAGLRILWESAGLTPGHAAQPITPESENMVFCCGLN